ncbi:acyltransferase family protein [Burkholderia thailandensis E444]|nr:AMP-binding protein [Burkholderia thailandensis]AHI77235.1 acyltransferase family protein [Burkholderia thailandensis 2002721723]AHI80874.1 acyltransferase family protein [Burkholderia thailandensis E444]AIS99173.1 acyltransferase family protein [Burkholderia thailandensis MSMB59]AIT23359.1 acyltransferase family protein [Burkholderia thailandensis E254]AJY01304.1 acyltransferase family protein [Burkholderia thailandensis 2002721643]KIS55140.1 acyltransferase family protein [Burkholderia t
MEHTQRLSDNATRLLALIDALLAELYGERNGHGRATLDARFERDLGFDSLTRAELFDRIERAFGVRLPVDVFASAATPADVVRALAAAHAQPQAAPEGEAGPAPPADAAAWPVEADTLIDVLNWHAERHPDRVHLRLLEDGLVATPLAYGELHRRASDLAGGLRERGIDPGDTVALMLPTGLDYFVSFTAVLFCGAIPVPIYPPANPAQLEEHVERHTPILENARIKALIAFRQAVSVAQLLKLRVSTLQHVFTPEQLVGRERLPPFRAAASDIALLQYTSGSTGTPKGVVLSHANLLANIRAMGDRMHVYATDVLVSWLPLYHDMGLIGAWLAPLYFGIPAVVMSPVAFLARPALWLRAISRYHGTITAAPNFAYERCARHLAALEPTEFDLSSLRFAFCGAEPVNADTLRAFAARFAACGFDARALTPVYGLAENTLGLTFPPPARGLHVDRIARAPLNASGQAVPAPGDANALDVPGCGYPIDGTELRIVGDDERELAERRVGRIEFRGTSATRGYYRNPAQTARLFHDAWRDTGDLGYVADGELYITGRAKDMIIRGGQHFFPYELEEAIGRLPGVAAGGVAVCGAADPASGTERVVIFVESEAADGAACERLRANVNDVTAARWGMPAEQVSIVAPHSILKTPSGKIRHAATLAQFERCAGRLPQASAPWRQFADLAVRSVAPFCSRVSRRAAQALRGLCCWALVALLAPVLWVRVAYRNDTRDNWRLAAQACRAFLRFADVRASLIADPDALAAGPSIVVANHTSYLDVVALLALLPSPVHFVAKRELATRPFVGRFLRALGTRFVERRDYGRSVEDEARLVAQAAADETLLFFPEGTFTRAAGLAAFRLGAFRAACIARRPVVPVVVSGARAVLRDGEWAPRRGEIAVTMLAPIFPDGTDFGAMARLRDRARDAILSRCGEPDLRADRAPRAAFASVA